MNSQILKEAWFGNTKKLTLAAGGAVRRMPPVALKRGVDS